MVQLVGCQLMVELPKKVLDFVGDIEGEEVINEVIELFIAPLSDEEKQKIKEGLPYTSKSMFIPAIVSGMVETDATFMQSLDFSKDQIEQSVAHFKQILDALNEDEDMKEMFGTMMSGIMQMAKDMVDELKSSDENGNERIMVNLPKMTPAFYHMLVKAEMVSLAEKIAEDDNMRNTITSNIINPLKDAIINVFKKIQEKLDMDDDDMEEFSSQFEGDLDVFYVSFPLQTILSIVLEKALDEDVSFTEASAGLSFENIFGQVSERIAKFDKIPKLADMFEELIDMILKLADM